MSSSIYVNQHKKKDTTGRNMTNNIIKEYLRQEDMNSTDTKDEELQEYTMYFQICNIDCSGCISNIESKIKEIYEKNGLINVSASFVTNKLKVTIKGHSRNTITPESIQNVVESCGIQCKFLSISENRLDCCSFSDSKEIISPAKAESIKDEIMAKEFFINVDGMSCSSCEAHLTKRVLSLNGVLQASFSALTKQAKIVINLNKISIREVICDINFGKFTANLRERTSKFDIRAMIKAEEIKKWRKVCFAMIFWIPICVLIWIVPNINCLTEFMSMFPISKGVTLYVYIICALSLMLQCYLGGPLYFSAWNAFKHKTSNMDTLIVIGTTASFLYGIAKILIGYKERYPYEFRENQIHDVYEHAHCFEASSTILFVVSVGKFLETYAKSVTVKKLADLASIKVNKASLMKSKDSENINFNDSSIDIHPNLLNINDFVKVINGQIIPTDGTIVYGQGFCDESMMTGESIPNKKDIGSKVFGGTILIKGSIVFRVDSIEEDNSLNKIINLVTNAQTSKAPIQRYADQISSYFVPFIILCACIAWITWFIAVYKYDHYFSDIKCKFSFAFTFGISTVVIACPCALGLATPTAVMICSGVAASHGILIKGGDVLERTSKLTTIVFDKTGTLTEGNLQITDINILSNEFAEKDISFITAICEAQSEHLIGKTISKHLQNVFSSDELRKYSDIYSLVEFENTLKN